MERKKSPNRLVVEDAVNDDNSVVALHPNTMERLQLFRGDTVMLKVRCSEFAGAKCWCTGSGKTDRAPSTVPLPLHNASLSPCPLFAIAGQEAQGHGVHRAHGRHCGRVPHQARLLRKGQVLTYHYHREPVGEC
eukprot:scaffold23421_cov20-Tisochrysis_lutea.AAC.1